MNTNHPTRGKGLLEDFLAKKRAEKATALLTDLDKKQRILDIGCGTYPFFLLTSDFKEKFGIDPSLSIASSGNTTLIKKDVTAQKLPFKENYFDAVTLLAVFEHIEKEKLNGLLKEINRVLKKDGMLVITTPASWSDKLLHNMAKVGLISSEEIHEHKHNQKKRKIIDIIKSVGFGSVDGGYFEFFMNMWFRATK